MSDVAAMQHHFAASSRTNTRSLLYRTITAQIADDPEVAALLLVAPPEQRLPVLLLAAVHRIVLAEPSLDLARYYPSVGGSTPPADVYPLFREICMDRRDEISNVVATRQVQTNEVGRCSLLVAAMASPRLDDRPVQLVDIGASAGLNCQLDRFRYDFGPAGTVGSGDLTLECGVRGKVTPPTNLPDIAGRFAADASPLDITVDEDRRWLEACVWPDQLDRLGRLRQAIDIALRSPVRVVGRHALEALEHDVPRAQAAGGLPVIVNTWVLNYLDDAERQRYVRLLDRLGRSTDLTWLFAESPGLASGLPVPHHLLGEHKTVVMRIDWRDGERRDMPVGIAHPHGYWIHSIRP